MSVVRPDTICSPVVATTLDGRFANKSREMYN